jgi:hypothetical protein
MKCLHWKSDDLGFTGPFQSLATLSRTMFSYTEPC